MVAAMAFLHCANASSVSVDQLIGVLSFFLAFPRNIVSGICI